jgi:hypothetical protein
MVRATEINWPSIDVTYVGDERSFARPADEFLRAAEKLGASA